jgi:hypothetical protein
MTTEHLSAAVDAHALADLQRRAGEPDLLRAAVAERVGIPSDASLAMVISALDQALAERADGNVLPEGVGIVDAPTLAQLRADAEVGRTHRERELIAAAIHRGQIPPAARASWEQLFATDPASAQSRPQQDQAGHHPDQRGGLQRHQRGTGRALRPRVRRLRTSGAAVRLS